MTYINMMAYMNMMRALLGFQRSFLVVIHGLQPRPKIPAGKLLIENSYRNPEYIYVLKFFPATRNNFSPTRARWSTTGGCKLIFYCCSTYLGSKYRHTAQIWAFCGHFCVRYGSGYFRSWTPVGASTG